MKSYRVKEVEDEVKFGSLQWESFCKSTHAWYWTLSSLQFTMIHAPIIPEKSFIFYQCNFEENPF